MTKKNKEGTVHKTSIGGQALIEGVMMRGPKLTAMAVRVPDQTIEIESIPNATIKDKLPILKLPFLRGVVNFAESMIFGYKCLMKSAEKAGMDLEEEGEPGKFEKALVRLFGDNLMKAVGVVAMVLGVVLALGLFIFVPTFLIKMFNRYLYDLQYFTSLAEGIIKISVFILYLAAVSRMNEIKRVFEYHGAEHKTIACYEEGKELTVENARGQIRFHPRCGTSFILIVLILSIIVFMWVPSSIAVGYRMLLRLVTLPLIVGISYEFIKLAGRYDVWATRIVSAPGLWLQRLTTCEPDDSQLEVAIAAMSTVLTEEKQDDKW